MILHYNSAYNPPPPPQDPFNTVWMGADDHITTRIIHFNYAYNHI